MSSSRYDFVPYPWPVKPALLFLLGLPADASKEDYEAAWNKAVEPAMQGNWAKLLFQKEVARLQAEGRTYDQAWSLAQSINPGRALYAAWEREIEANNRKLSA